MADVWFSIAANAIDDPEDDLMSEDASSESSDPSNPALSPRPASSGEDTNAPSASSLPTASIPTSSAPTPPRGSFNPLDSDNRDQASQIDPIEDALERSLFESLQSQAFNDDLMTNFIARI